MPKMSELSDEELRAQLVEKGNTDAAVDYAIEHRHEPALISAISVALGLDMDDFTEPSA